MVWRKFKNVNLYNKIMKIILLMEAIFQMNLLTMDKTSTLII